MKYKRNRIMRIWTIQSSTRSLDDSLGLALNLTHNWFVPELKNSVVVSMQQMRLAHVRKKAFRTDLRTDGQALS